MMLSTRDDTPVYDIGVVGCGPRGAFLNISMVLVVLAEADQIKAIHLSGTPFKIRLHTFEKQPWALRAVGNAYSPRSHGTMNTAPIGPEHINIPNLDKIAPKFKELVEVAIDLRGSIVKFVEENYDETMAEYQRVNTAAAANLRQAMTPSGKIDATMPFITRGTHGKFLQKQFDFVMSEAQRHIPLLEFSFHYETDVVHCDLTTDPSRPLLVTKPTMSADFHPSTRRAFDHVVFATGTTSKTPFVGPALDRTFLGEANLDDIQQFYKRFDLLHTNGKLKSDARILILGTSLSAMDNAVIGSRSAQLASDSESETLGSVFDDYFQDYKGVFTAVSSDGSRFVAPNLSRDTAWPEHVYFPLTPLIIRAALMDRSCGGLAGLLKILTAAVARSLGSLPSQAMTALQCPSIIQREILSQLLSHSKQTTAYGAGVTWSGLLQLGILKIFTGGDVQSGRTIGHDTRLSSVHRIVKDRAGLHFLRSLASYNTKLERASDQKCGVFHEAHSRAFRSFVAAASGSVAHYFANLFEQGVMSHQESPYRDIHLDPEAGKVKLNGQSFDCVLGSRILSAEGNVLLRALTGKVKESFPGKPHFAKGRLYQTVEGTLCNATELGLIGHGKQVIAGTGKKIFQDVDWTDTNNHASVVEGMPNLAKYMLIKVALHVNGIQDPASEIYTQYTQQWAPRIIYNQAVDAMRDAFQEFHEMMAYGEFCEKYAGEDASQYAEAYDEIITAERRQRFVRTCGNSSQRAEFERSIAAIPHFDPKTREEYYDGFIDYTYSELDAIWTSTCGKFVAYNLR